MLPEHQGESAMTKSATNGHDPANDPILGRHEVAQARKISVATLDRMVAAGIFPAPIRLSARRVGWRRSVAMNYSVAATTTPKAA
jgi:predicted DNA-binding transcriptional regulator AlpA